MECPGCGADIDEDDDYCSKCGRALSGESAGKVAEKFFSYNIKRTFYGGFLLLALLPIIFIWRIVSYFLPLGLTQNRPLLSLGIFVIVLVLYLIVLFVVYSRYIKE